MVVAARTQAGDGTWSPVSPNHYYGVYEAVRESGAFERLAAGGGNTQLVGGEGGTRPQSRRVHYVTHEFFEVLGIRPARGRWFVESDDRTGAPLTAIISERYWRSALGGDPAVIGRELVVSDHHATVIGVAPGHFRGLNLTDPPDLYLPAHTVAGLANTFYPVLRHPSTGPTTWFTVVVGRLHPDATAAGAAARLNALPSEQRRGALFELWPAARAALPAQSRDVVVPFTSLLAATVALLLLIGCLTVGMLLLVRTEARRGELAVCLALGGTRRSLAGGVLVEGALLTFAGAVLAVPAAVWMTAGLRAFQLPGGVSVDSLNLSLDTGTWMAVATLAVVTSMLLAVVAVVLGVRTNAADALPSRSGSTPPLARRRLRSVLMTAQVATTVLLLIGTGLFARSVAEALTVNTTFDAGRVVTGVLSLASYGYSPERAASFFAELRTRLEDRPAIEAVSLAQGQITLGDSIEVDGVARPIPSLVHIMAVDDRYFRTLGLPIAEGRDFSTHDTMSTPIVALVSESLARLLAGGGSPLGLRITEFLPGRTRAAEVIGVVPDVIVQLANTEPLVVYYTLAQHAPLPSSTLVARARSDAELVKRHIADTIEQLDPLLNADAFLAVEERLAQQMGPQRLGRFVLGALGTMAFLLTLLGAYVLAEAMSSGRRREFGIRAALGASRAGLAGLVLGETVRLVGLGLVAGLALAWMGAGTIRAFLFRVEPLDPATLGAVAAAMLGLTLAVSLKPAIDSARVDLVHTLREE
jgi:putative ABC transport system permease protein